MTTEKIVQRVLYTNDPAADLIGLVDVLELYLGIGTGGPSACERLQATIADIQREHELNKAQLGTLTDIAERLGNIEALLAANGFETTRHNC